MARESSLWRWLSRARLDLGERLHMQRIENAIGAGVPDVEGYLSPFGQFWLELKSTKRPARDTTPVRFATRGREAQTEWLAARWRCGGNASYLLQVGEGPERALYLVAGHHGADLAAGIPESTIRNIAVCAFKKRVSPAVVLLRVVQCRSLFHSVNYPFPS